ncbi:MAG: phage portal protein [Verrucomicrobiales bacterium]|jgi:hypothetical protein|nr:phage portal protein [Verrucomicrobiales bacterium]
MNQFRRLLFNTALKIAAWSQIDATQYHGKRPYRPVYTKDLRRQLTPRDLQTLWSHANGLYLNLGPAKGAIVDKAVYAVGRAWRPRFTGADRDWGKAAAAWLAGQWYGACEAGGNMNDFVTCLLLVCIAVDRDGDCGILLTESEAGWPQFQLIPAQRIWSAPDRPAPAGCQWDKGVLYSPRGNPVRYCIVSGAPDAEAVEVEAANFIHVYDPEFFGQGRGLPAFTHAILDLQDYQSIQDYEKRASMIASSIALLETNEEGASVGEKLAGQKNDGFTSEEFEDGTIRYFKSGSGGKLEAWQHSRPGSATTDFLDRLLRNALAGVGWPYELLWSAKDARGANIRALVARAARTVEDRQDLLRGVAKRLVGYAVAKAVKTKRLPASPDWWRWDFTMPPHISVDAGYDAAADREDYALGFKNLADILAKWGKDPETHLRERAAEWQLLEQIAADTGVPVERLVNLALKNPAVAAP